MNQFNTLYSKEPNEPPIECNIQPPEAQFKSKTYPPNTIPVVSAITRRLNHHSIDDGDIEVHPSEFLAEFNSESVPNPNTTPIKPIDDDEMDHLLELFH